VPGRMKVPFGAMPVADKSKQLILQALDAKRISSGRYVREFEDRFAALAGAREAVAVSSGADADTLVLAVLHDFGARRGDEVIVPALSFVATGNAVLHAGFTPVFVDIERETLNIDPGRIEAAITPKTRAIMPVHLMGKPAPMDAILDIARRRGLYVVEDAAEAHGALYHGRPVGSIGDMGAFSLYIAHIITTGEGGIVTTQREDFGEILRSLRAHGRACACKQCQLSGAGQYCAKRFSGPNHEDIRFTFPRVGYSSKMNELEAALGLGALDLYHDILAARRRNLLYFLERFAPFAPWLTTFREDPGEQIGPHAIPIVVQPGAPFTRAALANWLEERGVETRTLFASMPTQCPGFAFLGATLGQFPNAEYIGRQGIHIGVHQELGVEEMQYALDTIRGFLQRHAR